MYVLNDRKIYSGKTYIRQIVQEWKRYYPHTDQCIGYSAVIVSKSYYRCSFLLYKNSASLTNMLLTATTGKAANKKSL